MKRSLSALCLLLALSIPAAGGEVDTPGKTAPPPPPPCSEDCATTSDTPTVSTFDAITLELILLMLGNIAP